MALKLDETPDSDQDLSRDGEGSLSAHELAAFDQIAAGYNDPQNKSLADSEINTSKDDGQDAAQTTAENGLYNPDSKRGQSRFSLGNFANRRNGLIVGGFGGGIATLLVGFAAIFPGLVPQYFGNLMDQMGEIQTNEAIRYRRTKLARVSDVFTADGRRGSAIIRDMEADGYRFFFDDPDDRNAITGITTPDSPDDPSRIVNNTTDGGVDLEIRSFIENEYRFSRFQSWYDSRTNALYDRFKVKRAPVNLATNDAGLDPDKTIANELRTGTNQDDVDLALRVEGDESLTDEERQQLLEDSAPDADSNDFVDIQRTAQEGDDYRGSDLHRINESLLTAPDQEAVELAERIAKNSFSIGGLIKGFAIGAAADLGDKACIVQNRLQAAVTGARTVKAATQLRHSALVRGAIDGERASLANSGLTNALFSNFTRPDTTGSTSGMSPVLAYAQNGAFSQAANDLARPSYAIDGQLSGVWADVQSIVSSLFFITPSSCKIIQNPITQIGAGVLEGVVGFFSGGSARAGSQLTKQAVKDAASGVFTRAFARQTGRNLGKTATVEASFEGTMILMQMYAQRNIKNVVSGFESGALFTSMSLTGAGTLHKQRGLNAGLVPTFASRYSVVHEEYLAQKKEELKNKSFFTRIFDVTDPDSLAFKTVPMVPMSGESAVAQLQSSSRTFAASPFSFGNDITNGVANIVSGEAYAQDSDLIAFDTYETTEGRYSGEEFATDPGGNLLLTHDPAIEAIDPIDNRTVLIAGGHIDAEDVPISSQFTGHIENCVDNVDTISMLEKAGDSLSPEDDCMAELPLTKQFKAHLAWLDLNDTLDANLFPQELDTTTGSQDSGFSNYVVSGDFTWPIVQSQENATSNLGSCLKQGSETICHAGHPYLAHDLFATEGTPVVATAKGVVISAKTGTCGHGHGRAFSVQVYDEEQNITHFYQHLRADPADQKVATGDVVEPGTQLGVIGPTGAACDTPPHLHYDVVTGRGRPPCSRKSCTASNKARFTDVSRQLYEAWNALQ